MFKIIASASWARRAIDKIRNNFLFLQNVWDLLRRGGRSSLTIKGPLGTYDFWLHQNRWSCLGFEPRPLRLLRPMPLPVGLVEHMIKSETTFCFNKLYGIRCDAEDAVPSLSKVH